MRGDDQRFEHPPWIGPGAQLTSGDAAFDRHRGLLVRGCSQPLVLSRSLLCLLSPRAVALAHARSPLPATEALGPDRTPPTG